MTDNRTATRLIKTAIAGVILLALFASWLAMEWTGREPDSLILIGAVAIALGAGYYLWDDAMSDGVQAVGDLQGEDGGDSQED
ncbi:hypothetical protein EL22_16915 [Halostagnicola sp. A56]|uniref:hypothetical protein n=1 Tax=Halostagnicola sp. A56 TaxID=1495067 RepID=UPI0004A029AD|nr:hypothetical protein [Halostagnicola sp. A56]KDE59808.1 hypothetical protein EL22_16915 [Halostagnicola sp. A56]